MNLNANSTNIESLLKDDIYNTRLSKDLFME